MHWQENTLVIVLGLGVTRKEIKVEKKFFVDCKLYLAFNFKFNGFDQNFTQLKVGVNLAKR